MAFQPRNIGTHNPHEPVVLPPAPPSLIVPTYEDPFSGPLPDDDTPRDAFSRAMQAAHEGKPLALERMFAQHPNDQDLVRTSMRSRGFPYFAEIVLENAYVATLNEPVSWHPQHDGAAPIPRWWHTFRHVEPSCPQRVHFHLLRLLRAYGANLDGTPFNEERGGEHGDVLRAFLVAERVAAEQAVLRQAAAEVETTAPAAPARRRL
ncbi:MULTISPECIES: hypothetical protein [Burkholderiaceae]|jgi:hypothetical protein|uniref:hypothetical protein n=1 Tax=Burkholderiaceae TaxID=119060 RepID=UPI0010418E53|nr:MULTISPECIES: hypothetical protein [Burkholderiaceae]MCI1041786.1 hypothetical protein [Caballeronia zhejiangensis]